MRLGTGEGGRTLPALDGCSPSTHRSSRRYWIGGLQLAFAAVLAGAGTFLFYRLFLQPAPARTPSPSEIASSVGVAMTNRDRMLLQWDLSNEGGEAPNLVLPDIDSNKPVSLANFRGRPVVLLFGSFTCDLFCKQARELEKLYQKYKDRAAFLLVYVGEPGHKIPELEALFADVDPGPAGRRERARRGRKAFGLTIPTVLDSEDLATMLAYDASPRRLVCVGKDGRIVFDAGKGLPESWDFVAVQNFLDQWLN
jgi:hypothetical protein